jgi:hypothetical protein
MLVNNMFDIRKIKFKIARKMRYNDYGDYYNNKVISYDTKNKLYNYLIHIHELIEYSLLSYLGVHWSEIDRFDRARKKPTSKHYKLYGSAHRIATRTEKMIAKLLNINWKKYCEDLKKLKVKVIK